MLGSGLVIGSLAVVIAGLAAGAGWFFLAPGVRRQRAVRRAGQFLRSGDWQQALALVQSEGQRSDTPELWRSRLRHLEEDCRRRGGEAALIEKRFEEGLGQLQTAARLAGSNGDTVRTRVSAVMLEEVRRLFATADPESTLVLIGRVFAVESPCPEASFWQGLCQLRQGRQDEAIASLRTAQERSENRFLDPAFYLGALLRRQENVTEAMRYLAEANRLAPNSGPISIELGQCILAAGGNSLLAVHALLRGMQKLGGAEPTAKAGAAWVEGLPEAHSFVRRLADKYLFTCPVLGTSVVTMMRTARAALAEANYRLGNFAEAVELYQGLLQEAPPTPSLWRGLGRALARQGKYDDAYRHLRAAHEQQAERPDPFTVGYLALSAARARPPRPEDQAPNIAWALGLLTSVDVPANAEWAEVSSAVHMAARANRIAISRESQVRLCESLASVRATDPDAAGAYQHLSATYPDAVRPVHAWLYCRAVQQHGLAADNDLDLFSITFRETEAARAFFAEQGWDFDALELIFLERAAVRAPGRFPEAFGSSYSTRGEQLLLDRSRQQETTGHLSGAMASMEVLLKLAPDSAAAHDRLAALCFRKGDFQRSANLLSSLHALSSTDPRPLIRRAIVEQRLGQKDLHPATLAQALELCPEHGRSAVAFLGARLALADLVLALDSPEEQPRHVQERAEFQQARTWLEMCLVKEPNHPQALWCQAALLALAGDVAGVASHAGCMREPDVEDGYYHFLAALCKLTSGDHAGALSAARRAAAAEPKLAMEAAYLGARAQLALGDISAAGEMLEKATRGSGSAMAEQARAFGGILEFQRGRLDTAIASWQTVSAEHRDAWKLDEPLRSAIYLAGLHDLRAGRFQQAANRFREAGRSGSRERHLGALLIYALIQEGHRLSREVADEQRNQGPRLIEQALTAGCRDAKVFYSLALAYKRLGSYREARAALGKIAAPDALDCLQLAVLALADGQIAPAEQDLTQAHGLAPDSREIVHNLVLTRLALGQVDAGASLAPAAVAAAGTRDEADLWHGLQGLLTACSNSNGNPQPDRHVSDFSPVQEAKLLALIHGLGRLDVQDQLTHALFQARPESPAAREASDELRVLKARREVERCSWEAAERFLEPLTSAKGYAGPWSAAVLNLLGCCAVMRRDLSAAVRHFSAALTLAGPDARLEQNLALVHERQREWASADAHWDRYFQLLERGVPAAPGREDYVRRLAYEGLSRLAAQYVEHERWTGALTYAQRLANLHPDDQENLERLFHLYSQSGLTDEARRALRRLRQVRPNQPHLDIYDRDLLDTRGLDGIDQMLDDVESLLRRHPNDGRAEIRALDILSNAVPLLEKSHTQLADRLARIMNQIRHLPRYQVEWSAVHAMMGDLRSEFARLRKLVSKCTKLVREDEQREKLNELYKSVEKQISQCRATGA
jgi:tetratricopeptide (TPR) repeat protein